MTDDAPTALIAADTGSPNYQLVEKRLRRLADRLGYSVIALCLPNSTLIADTIHRWRDDGLLIDGLIVDTRDGIDLDVLLPMLCEIVTATPGMCYSRWSEEPLRDE
ncbi:hypothetical protein [Nocardia sp. BMG51109]|uniref:hypothetical protein n=1 Tax=Nocardia sp. BMG51109 TaxID=1056816 RepID=UPI0004675887|nr:hypothetical protein [Nocardia sp. BMG51109]